MDFSIPEPTTIPRTDETSSLRARCDNQQIVMIAEFQSRRFLRQRLDLVFAQETVDLRNGGRREAELASQNCFQLFEYDLSGYQRLPCSSMTRRKTSLQRPQGVKGASKATLVSRNVFHEPTLNTSSSVKSRAPRRTAWPDAAAVGNGGRRDGVSKPRGSPRYGSVRTLCGLHRERATDRHLRRTVMVIFPSCVTW